MNGKFFYFVNLYDIFIRVNINEFFFNNFFFYWIQFFILPTFIIFIVFYYFIFFIKNKNAIIHLLLVVIISFLLWWVTDYYFINNNPTKVLNTPNLFNNLLFNSLNKYHPVFFFTCYLYVYRFITFIDLYSNFRRQTFISFTYKTSYKLIFIKNLNYVWWLLLMSLYLGSWWAIQEGSWGGWWNWDASEVFGLFILTIYLLMLHTYSPYIYYLRTYTLLVTLCSVVVIIYFVLQLSYTLVSHNFGLNMLDYGYVSFVFSNLLAISLVFYLFLQKKVIYVEKYNHTYYRSNSVNSFFKKSLSLNNIFKYVLTLLVTYLYTLSFNPIINNVFWTSFSVEFFNNWFIWLNVQVTLLIITYVLFFTYNTVLNLYLLTYVSLLLFIWPFIIFVLNRRLNVISVFHIILFLSLFIPTLLSSSVFTTWEYSYTSVINYPLSLHRSSYICDIVVDNFYIINSSSTVYNSGFINLIKSFYWFNTNPSSQYFLMDSSNVFSTQSILSHTFNYPFKLSILDITPFILDFLTLVTLAITYYYILVKKIITL